MKVVLSGVGAIVLFLFSFYVFRAGLGIGVQEAQFLMECFIFFAIVVLCGSLFTGLKEILVVLREMRFGSSR